MNPLLVRILTVIGAYLLGAVPTGYLAFRAAENKDIRSFGSGATGATNVLRLKGWRTALPVALFDMAKGFIPAFIAARLFADPTFSAACAAAAVAGHCFPVYIGFKGGKGVATAGGAMFALAPLPALGSLAVFAVTVASTRFVSLGSILAAAAFPAFLWLHGAPSAFILAGLPILAIIGLRHAANIGRLVRGTEPKLGEKVKVRP